MGVVGVSSTARLVETKVVRIIENKIGKVVENREIKIGNSWRE